MADFYQCKKSSEPPIGLLLVWLQGLLEWFFCDFIESDRTKFDLLVKLGHIETEIVTIKKAMIRSS